MSGTMPRLSGPVYPRWRGEHYFQDGFIWPVYGLSPLARGTQNNGLEPLISQRFIPAGAGNTANDEVSNAAAAVYPRWRGEHTRPTSPAFCQRAFIPAGAGNTLLMTILWEKVIIYPRWRGEHTVLTKVTRPPITLSPLARGTHTKDILLFYNSFLSTQQFTNFITTISHY